MQSAFQTECKSTPACCECTETADCSHAAQDVQCVAGQCAVPGSGHDGPGCLTIEACSDPNPFDESNGVGTMQSMCAGRCQSEADLVILCVLQAGEGSDPCGQMDACFGQHFCEVVETSCVAEFSDLHDCLF